MERSAELESASHRLEGEQLPHTPRTLMIKTPESISDDSWHKEYHTLQSLLSFPSTGRHVSESSGRPNRTTSYPGHDDGNPNIWGRVQDKTNTLVLISTPTTYDDSSCDSDELLLTLRQLSLLDSLGQHTISDMTSSLSSVGELSVSFTVI